MVKKLGVLDRADPKVGVPRHPLHLLLKPLLTLQPFRDLLSSHLQCLVFLLVAAHGLFLLALPRHLFKLNGALLDGLEGFSVHSHEFAHHALVEVDVDCPLLHGLGLAWTALFFVFDALPAVHGLKAAQDLQVEGVGDIIDEAGGSLLEEMSTSMQVSFGVG